MKPDSHVAYRTVIPYIAGFSYSSERLSGMLMHMGRYKVSYYTLAQPTHVAPYQVFANCPKRGSGTIVAYLYLLVEIEGTDVRITRPNLKESSGEGITLFV